MIKLRLDRGQIEVMDNTMAEILRRKSCAERIAIGFDMWFSATKMLAAHLRKSHPDWNENRVKIEVGRRMSRKEK